MKKYLTKRNLLFITIFTIAGFIALNIPVAELAGSKAKFTVYDSFAPIAGAFIGSVPGVIAVFLTQLANFFVQGANITDPGTVIRFFPMLFAVLYFTQKRKFILAVPAIAIIAFVMHPIGRTVWYFALFWTIPFIAHYFRRFLIARALGATFTAHAVGGALWIWTFSLPASVWNSLIPIVAFERILFALGIAVSFLAVNNLLRFLEKKEILTLQFRIEDIYLLPSLRNTHENQTPV